MLFTAAPADCEAFCADSHALYGSLLEEQPIARAVSERAQA
jgi:hypothetical protein